MRGAKGIALQHLAGGAFLKENCGIKKVDAQDILTQCTVTKIAWQSQE